MFLRVPSLVRAVVFTLTSASLLSNNAMAQSDRQGFTLLLDVGIGIQKDTAPFIEGTAFGVGGLNVGVGGFVTPDLAVMGRVVGTTAPYEVRLGPFVDEYTQTSGVLGGVVQYWPSDRLNIEAGAGIGVWTAEDVSDQGLGLILAAGFTVFNRGKHNLQMGIQYAPVFTSNPVHNVGITFGYQWF